MNIATHTKQGKFNAKSIGILYLAIAIIGGFSIGYMPAEVINLENSLQTSENFSKYNSLFYIGVLGDILVFILELILTVLLYQLFKTTSKQLSIIAAFSRLAMGVIMGINLINYIVPAFIYTQGTTILTNLQVHAQHDIAILFFYAHKIGEYCWQLFFSIHLFVLGILILKSSFVSKKIGIAMLIGSFGYLFQSLFFILDIHFTEISYVINILLTVAVIGELAFTFWLLIKDINTPKII